MNSTYGKAVSFAIPIFVALIAIEMIAAWIARKSYYRFADAVNSLSCGIASTGMRVFFGFIGLFFYETVYLHLAPMKLPAGNWMVWVFAFVLYDLCYYWYHRAGHVIGLFWASHVVHHQSEEFNLTTALRQPGTGDFLGWIFYMPLALCGVPIPVFAVVGVAQLFYQFWPHTRLIGKMGVFDRLVQTPSNHRVHHAQNDIYLDKNYVGVFMIWDHLFGTYQDELEEEPCIYGIRGQLQSWNPVWANFHYYWAMAKDSWRAENWLDKGKVWFAHPGWRPADVAASYPKKAYDPRRDFERFDPERPGALSLYVLAQFVVLMAMTSQFLSLLPLQAKLVNLTYFGFIIFSLVALGGLLENRRDFWIVESARLAMASLGCFMAGGWFGPVLTGPRAIAGILAFTLASAIFLWMLRLKPSFLPVSPHGR